MASARIAFELSARQPGFGRGPRGTTLSGGIRLRHIVHTYSFNSFAEFTQRNFYFK
jgi:hypothetical protein